MGNKHSAEARPTLDDIRSHEITLNTTSVSSSVYSFATNLSRLSGRDPDLNRASHLSNVACSQQQPAHAAVPIPSSPMRQHDRSPTQSAAQGSLQQASPALSGATMLNARPPRPPVGSVVTNPDHDKSVEADSMATLAPAPAVPADSILVLGGALPSNEKDVPGRASSAVATIVAVADHDEDLRAPEAADESAPTQSAPVLNTVDDLSQEQEPLDASPDANAATATLLGNSVLAAEAHSEEQDVAATEPPSSRSDQAAATGAAEATQPPAIWTNSEAPTEAAIDRKTVQDFLSRAAELTQPPQAAVPNPSLGRGPLPDDDTFELHTLTSAALPLPPSATSFIAVSAQAVADVPLPSGTQAAPDDKFERDALIGAAVLTQPPQPTAAVPDVDVPLPASNTLSPDGLFEQEAVYAPVIKPVALPDVQAPTTDAGANAPIPSGGVELQDHGFEWNAPGSSRAVSTQLPPAASPPTNTADMSDAPVAVSVCAVDAPMLDPESPAARARDAASGIPPERSLDDSVMDQDMYAPSDEAEHASAEDILEDILDDILPRQEPHDPQLDVASAAAPLLPAVDGPKDGPMTKPDPPCVSDSIPTRAVVFEASMADLSTVPIAAANYSAAVTAPDALPSMPAPMTTAAQATPVNALAAGILPASKGPADADSADAVETLSIGAEDVSGLTAADVTSDLASDQATHWSPSASPSPAKALAIDIPVISIEQQRSVGICPLETLDKVSPVEMPLSATPSSRLEILHHAEHPQEQAVRQALAASLTLKRPEVVPFEAVPESPDQPLRSTRSSNPASQQHSNRSSPVHVAVRLLSPSKADPENSSAEAKDVSLQLTPMLLDESAAELDAVRGGQPTPAGSCAAQQQALVPGPPGTNTSASRQLDLKDSKDLRKPALDAKDPPKELSRTRSLTRQVSARMKSFSQRVQRGMCMGPPAAR